MELVAMWTPSSIQLVQQLTYMLYRVNATLVVVWQESIQYRHWMSFLAQVQHWRMFSLCCAVCSVWSIDGWSPTSYVPPEMASYYWTYVSPFLPFSSIMSSVACLKLNPNTLWTYTVVQTLIETLKVEVEHNAVSLAWPWRRDLQVTCLFTQRA